MPIQRFNGGYKVCRQCSKTGCVTLGSFYQHVRDVNRSSSQRRIKPKGFTLITSGTATSYSMMEWRSGTVPVKTSGDTYYPDGLPATNWSVYPSLTSPLSQCRLPSQGGALGNRNLAKARGEAVNFAMMLAEYDKTASLFVELAKFVARVGKAAVMKNPKLLLPKQGWDKATAKANLQFQYGVRPLVGDLVTAVGLMSQKSPEMFRKFSSNALSAKDWSANTKVLYDGSLQDVGRLFHETRSDRVTTYVAYKPAVPLSFLESTGFTNLPLLMWELVPFSFVIDWSINVGEVLESMDDNLKFDSIYSITGYKRSLQEKVTWFNCYDTYWEEVVRNAVVKQSYVAQLCYKPSTSLQHIANGISLLTPLRGRR